MAQAAAKVATTKPGLRVLEAGELREQLSEDRSYLISELQQATAQVGSDERRRLQWIARCDNAELWRDEDCRSTAEWLSRHLGITQWKAARFVKAAHVLETLPLTSAALEAGALSLDKVVELTRFATPLTEKKLLTWARRVGPSAIKGRADREAAKSLPEVKEAIDARCLTWWWQTEGDRLSFEGQLPAAEGSAFIKAIDRLAGQLADASKATADGLGRTPEGDGQMPEAGSTIDQRRADALCLMASARIANDQDHDRATVVVHAPLEALTHDRGTCEVAGGPGLHPETVRRLSCDARLQIVLEGKEGNALGIGDTSQVVPFGLRRQVFKRDHHVCTYPGCGTGMFLHPHHIKHWTWRGPTDLDNLITVCTRHHNLVHEGGWSVSRTDDGVITWFKPSGRIYDPGAPLPDPDEVERRRPPPDKRLLIEARSYSRLLALVASF